MTRVMCVYLPQWPLQRLRRQRPELRGKPVALVDAQAARGAMVLLCSAPAGRAGIRPTMPVAEALAIDPTLCIEETNPERDLESLKQLAGWAERYSPIVGLEEGPNPQSLLLNITGCAGCFHGEDRLLERAARELAQDGWTARLAVADTPGAAWALAHFARTPLLAPPGQTEKFLNPLPVAALRLPSDTLETLARLGLDRIGPLNALPRAGLVSRFGPMLLERLDQALGRLPEPLAPYRFRPPLLADFPFDPPTERRQALSHALEPLTERLHELLQQRHWGARQIECWVHHETAAPLRLEVNLYRPSQSPSYLRLMLEAELERAAIAAPVSGMRLHVSQTEPMADRQAELFDADPPHSQDELAALIDRLSSRLGRDAVTRPALVADAQPECACRLEPLIQIAAAGPKGARGRKPPPSEPPLLVRPVRLLPRPIFIEAVSVVPDGPPIQFRWAGTSYRVTRAWGPERIETGWWRHAEALRDYYVVATHLGNRFWLFRQRDEGRWFLHGCFE